jgi:type VI secretion system protein ImpC
MRIAILGDFGGSAKGGIGGIRPPVEVDRDNFDAVMAQWRVEARIPVAGAIRFRDLDGFHPDLLYATLDMFAGLREAAGAASGPPPSAPPSERASEPPSLGLNGLLDQAIEETAGRAENRRPEVTDDFQLWLRERVAPHLQPAEEPAAAARRALIEQAASIQMRALLHFPEFQALEAAWRSLLFLVRRIDTGETLRLYLIDVSKDELAGDLGRSADWRESVIGQTLLESAGAVGGDPWSLLTGNYRFGPSADDLDLLARLGTMAASLGAPWLAGADPVLRREPVAPGWAALRRNAVARWIGLAWPRFLLRLPYGKDTDACERFAFEEMPDPPEHERYLWGNPAFACTVLLAQSFAERGWQFRPGMHLNLGGLPFDVRTCEGEKRAQPCAEFYMSEVSAESILESGIMPLASLKETDEVRLVRFQSIASPPAALAGRWGPGTTTA